jgi:hypothetical protein
MEASKDGRPAGYTFEQLVGTVNTCRRVRPRVVLITRRTAASSYRPHVQTTIRYSPPGMPTWLDPIALLALVVSIISLAVTWRLGHRQNALELAREQDRQRDAKRAQLVATVVRRERGPGFTPEAFLHVRNDGRATARNVAMSFDGRPFREHPLTEHGEPAVPSIGPGTDVRFFLKYTDQRTFELELTWDDDTGEPGRWTSTMKR